MRKLVTAAMLASMVAGCADTKSAEAVKSRAELNSKLTEFSAAQKDFIPPQEGKGDNQLERKTNLVAYHRDKVSKASADLKSILEKLEPAQRVAALRLIAKTQIGDAMAYSRDADTAGAKYSAQASALLGYLGSVERDVALITSSQGTDGIKILDTLKVDADSTQKGLKTLEADAAQVRDSQIAPAQTEIDKLKSESEATRIKSADLRAKAFGKDGQAQFDAYKIATDTERQSQISSTKAQNLQVTVEVNQSKLKLLERAIEQQKTLLESQRSQIDSIEKRQASIADVREKAKIEAKDTADKMNEQIDAISKAIDQQVETPYTAAQKSATDAVNSLTEALRLASSQNDKKAVQIDLLSAQTLQAYIVTQRIMTANSYGRLLGLIDAAGKKFNLPVGDKSTIEAATQRDNQRKAGADASSLIEDALKLAATLTDPAAAADDLTAIQIKSLYDSLNNYKSRIADLTPASGQ